MKHLLKRFPFNVLLLLIFVVVVIVVHSCRRDIVHPNSSVAVKTLATHGVDISKLQAAYQQGTGAGKLKTMDVGSQAMANIISTLNVDWSSYTLQEFADSSKIIEFPMPDDTTLIAPRDSLQNGHKKYASKTAAVFILHKDTIVLNFFMKTVEDQNNPNYQSVINQLHYLSVPGGFNGEVLYFTLGRQFINGYLWKGGSITKAISLTSVATPPTPQSQSYKGKLKVDEIALVNCTIEYYDVVWTTTVTYGNNPPVTTVEPTGQSFSVTTCDITDSGGGSGGATSGGVSGGGGATPTPVPCVPASAPAMTSVKSGRLVVDVAAGGSGGTGSTGGTSSPVPCPTTTTPASILTIIDSIQNPCLRAAVESAISKGLDTYTSQIANFVFGDNTSFDLTFKQTTSLASNISGKTDCQGVPQQQGYFLAEVSLNANTLPYASNEYTASTVIHEILHAYFTFSGKLGEFNQHTDMANNYIYSMQKDLQTMFPSLSDTDAQALAWGGLGDTQAWKDLVANNPTLANSIVNINQQYENATGTKGTRCTQQ